MFVKIRFAMIGSSELKIRLAGLKLLFLKNSDSIMRNIAGLVVIMSIKNRAMGYFGQTRACPT